LAVTRHHYLGRFGERFAQSVRQRINPLTEPLLPCPGKLVAFVAKIAFLMFVFVWVRWTIPRLKYDLLMKLGWKVFLPLAIVNIVLVAFFIVRGWI
jgi:NADH:ubiquinone oxidoreductase subunit H